MEKSFLDLYDAMKLNRRKCPWAKTQDLKRHVRELEKEVVELKQAIDKKDVENMREEIGDVFWDLMFISVIAEEEGLFTLKNSLDEVSEKIKRRKPWVFGSETVSSREEAIKRWFEQKGLEKRDKHK